MGAMEDEPLPPGYPAQWEADVVLRDGTVAHVRPIRPADTAGIHRFHAAQSDESIYLRFFAPLRRLSDSDVHRFTHVDYVDRVALVATMREEIIGIGRYDRIDPRSAEVAFNISDLYQGKGIGSVLLEHLAAIAREVGISRFTAEVLPQNRKMLAVFSDAGYDVTRHVEDGVVEVGFDIEPTDQSKAVAMSREHRAEALSVRSVLHPRTIAVVGASRRKESIGSQLLDRLVDAGFTGRIHPVNPNVRTLRRRRAYPSVERRARTRSTSRSSPCRPTPCSRSSTSAPRPASSRCSSCRRGSPRRARTARGSRPSCVRRARGAGMRVVGPNSFGLINNDPEVRLNASLAPTLPPHGRLGLFAQSGALGIAVLASAARRNLGISTFGSAGNRVDVSGNDFMQYWIDDDGTDAVGLYLESMGNPRKFSRIARNLALIKPVIVVKSGVSPVRRAARATGCGRTKARPEVFSAMLKQAGVIRVENVHQLFDVAQLVVHQPLPAGDRVAIVANSTALGTLTADACASWKLTVTHGPVSLPSEATAAEFREALTAAFADPRVDSVLTCFIPPLVTGDEDVAAAVRDTAAAADKPIAATFLGMRGVDDGHATVSGTGGATRAIPVYAMPEDAVRALAAATRYGQWRAKDQGTPVAPGRHQPPHRRGPRPHGPLGRPQGPAPRARTRRPRCCRPTASTCGPTTTCARSTRPSPSRPSRSATPSCSSRPRRCCATRAASAGVRVDLRTEAALRAAWDSLTDRLAPLDADRLVVQRMATPGVPCVVTSDEDPLFGPVIGFSVAGLPTELLGDIAYRIPPLTDVTVSELISSVKAAPVLHGHRGATPVHRAALADLIARVSVLADDLPEVASLVLNPVNAHPGGVEVLGAEIVLAPAPRRTDPGRGRSPDAGARAAGIRPASRRRRRP